MLANELEDRNLPEFRFKRATAHRLTGKNISNFRIGPMEDSA